MSASSKKRSMPPLTMMQTQDVLRSPDGLSSPMMSEDNLPSLRNTLLDCAKIIHNSDSEALSPLSSSDDDSKPHGRTVGSTANQLKQIEQNQVEKSAVINNSQSAKPPIQSDEDDLAIRNFPHQPISQLLDKYKRANLHCEHT
jgi:hypothetical protein